MTDSAFDSAPNFSVPEDFIRAPDPTAGHRDDGAVNSAGNVLRLLRQRWHIPTVNPLLVEGMALATGLPPLLAQVLVQRGIVTPEQAVDFLNPERQQLPSPLVEFPDLAVSLDLLIEAIETGQSVAICGDYDADGMTSTALLLRALRILGANVHYVIPSRMSEGYGINQRIVEDCHANGVSLILTVDNGIAACAPIERARELGLAVIVTDHHDIPPQLPPANAILNPKLLPEFSPYRGVAGVGVAYILAVCLAQALDQTQDLTAPLLELFTLGTIADLAPLTGVNRRWVRRGLGLLPRSRILGIQALIQVAGLADQNKPLKPEHIGFRLGPRINAVGRISDPQIVIDLLTTEDVGTALERAMQCEQINTNRQDLCQQIEQEAIDWCEQQQQLGTIRLEQERVLLVVQPHWHHGVIGIVASRLVERYGVPVFIGTYEDDGQKIIRGSARGIPEFDVFEALQSCDDLMEKFGGHRAAGGFSFLAKHLRQVKSRLVNYAGQHLLPDMLKPLVAIDAQASLREISQTLYDQIDQLHPCGIENPEPVFWTPKVQILEQQMVGRGGEHLKLTLRESSGATIKAIAWRWGEFFPLPEQVDVAYRLKQNEWQGVATIELELVAVRLSGENPGLAAPTHPGMAAQAPGVQPAAGAVQPLKPPPPASESGGTPKAGGNGRGAERSAAYSGTKPGPLLPDLNRKTTVPARSQRLETTPGALPNSPGQAGPSAAPGSTAEPLAGMGVPLAQVSDDVDPRLDPRMAEAAATQGTEFVYSQRRYRAERGVAPDAQQFTISNPEGQVLRVNLTTGEGFLDLPGSAPKSIDMAEAHYANLIQAGSNALEIQRLTQLLTAREAQLAEQDGQIQALKNQLAHLQSQLQNQRQGQGQAQTTPPKPYQSAQNSTNTPTNLTNLPAQPKAPAVQSQPQPLANPSVKAGPSASPPVGAVEPQTLRQQVRAAIGDKVWFCLAAQTQQDLYTAFQQRDEQAQANTGAGDYSGAAVALTQALEREILMPLLQGLNEYSQQCGDAEIESLAISLSEQASLWALPGLLAESWKALTDKALQADTKPRRGLHHTVRAEHWTTGWEIGGAALDDTHRVLLDEFLQGWEHPAAAWMAGANEVAATALGQVSQLMQVAQDDQRPMPQWQYQVLQQLILGERQTKGLFQRIFGEASA